MILKFDILGLLMMFMLIIIYYKKEFDGIRGRSIFRFILILGYICELLYLVTYIISHNGLDYGIFVKCYLSSVVILFILFSDYYLLSLLKNKYKNQDESYVKRKKLVRNVSIVVGTLFVGGIFLSKVEVADTIIKNYNHSLFILLLEVNVLVSLTTLLIGSKWIKAKEYSYLFILLLIEIFAVVLEYYISNIEIMNNFIMIMVTYLYFVIENPEKIKKEVMQLERDHAIKNKLDKSSFLKNLSYEIRGPINTIDGFSQVIIDSDDITEIKEDAKDIRLASKDLIDIINGMIDLSIIESGSLEIIRENYNIYDVIDNIIAITKSKLKSREVKFISEIEEDMPQVLLGDSERISQIILNLISNSIKYTEKGKIELNISALKSSSICRLKIVVKDTGRGMKDEEVDHLFDGENGLGLKVSKYLIDEMEGKIDVESKQNEGTIFTISIDQKIISEYSTSKDSNKKEIKPFSAKDKRVLLVDDNKLNLKVATKLLAPYEVEVVISSSGKECLDILDKDTNFDLILMDDMMPEMTGTEALSIIKKLERVDGYYIPIVVLTANATAGTKEKYLNAGFEDYLSKPIERRELDRILRKYLRGKK